MTFDQWWDKETEAVGRKGVGRNGVFYQLAKRAWVAAERKEREACAKVCESFGGNGSRSTAGLPGTPRIRASSAVRPNT